MMSQAEIYNMQNYCMRKNRELDGLDTTDIIGQARTADSEISLIGAIVFLMGAALATMSACLVIYVVWATVAMTGWTFMIIGIAGIISGVIAMVLAKAIIR